MIHSAMSMSKIVKRKKEKMNEEYLECYDCQAVVPSSRFYFCESCGLGFCDMCGITVEAGEDFTEDVFFCRECRIDGCG